MNKKVAVLVGVFILLFSYWFGLRPTMIKKKCAGGASFPGQGLKVLDQFITPTGMTDYEYCLHSHGL